MKVPFLDLPLQYRSLQSEIDAALRKTIAQGIFIGGEEVETFERAFARQLRTDHCIGVGNGTDALFLALKALGIRAGDAVIVPANSFIASAEAVTMTGAAPVFVDCDPKTYLMDIDDAERLLAKNKTIKAIMPVHLFGRAVDMEKVMTLAARFSVFVVEDCAQAHFASFKGRAVGTFGDAGCFSFYPGKNLGAYGDAGAIVTRRADLAETLRKLHDHGRTEKYVHDFPGINSRLDSVQASILNVKLPKVAAWNRIRSKHARTYIDLLKSVEGIELPEVPQDNSHVFHLFVIRSKTRDTLQKALKEKGIATGVHYPIALPNQPAYKSLGHKPEDFPVATANQAAILSLPMFPELTSDQITYVVDGIKSAIQARR